MRVEQPGESGRSNRDAGLERVDAEAHDAVVAPEDDPHPGRLGGEQDVGERRAEVDVYEAEVHVSPGLVAIGAAPPK